MSDFSSDPVEHKIHDEMISRFSAASPVKKMLQRMYSEKLTLAELASLNGCKVSTYDKHMRSAKRMLGTRTVAGTLAAALKAGLIEDA